MKKFRSLVILRSPPDKIWMVMRDHMAELAAELPDIESVSEVQRHLHPTGITEIINEWRVRFPLPAAARSMLGSGDLGWIDRNGWNDHTHICSWKIEPFFLTDYIACEGRTIFEPAMGGNGSRITLEGELELKSGFLGRFGAVAEKPVAGIVESVVTTIIPRNLRGMLELAAAFNELKPGQPRSTL